MKFHSNDCMYKCLSWAETKKIEIHVQNGHQDMPARPHKLELDSTQYNWSFPFWLPTKKKENRMDNLILKYFELYWDRLGLKRRSSNVVVRGVEGMCVIGRKEFNWKVLWWHLINEPILNLFGSPFLTDLVLPSNYVLRVHTISAN